VRDGCTGAGLCAPGWGARLLQRVLTVLCMTLVSAHTCVHVSYGVSGSVLSGLGAYNKGQP
jgi:hypothetical protein